LRDGYGSTSFLISRQIIQMDVCNINGSQSIASSSSSGFAAIALKMSRLSRDIDLLLKSLFHALVSRVKVVGASVFEGELELQGRDVGRDATALDGLHECSPDIGSYPRCDDMRIVGIEERSGERLELRCRCGG
jgi:hypothetical protein